MRLSKAIQQHEPGGLPANGSNAMTRIADRKLAKEVLRHSEDSLRLIIDTIPTMAWALRPDGTVDFINQRWLDHTGLSLKEEIERPDARAHLPL